ncbi:hypothetical protein [Glutamicibacter sp. AOP5-A2-18]|uniref:hypothetical protein n=1 Tax=Glutamicibacter sp. AOP5-A2-18 TaxID=3457656 RepID=UPI0040347336
MTQVAIKYDLYFIEGQHGATVKQPRVVVDDLKLLDFSSYCQDAIMNSPLTLPPANENELWLHLSNSYRNYITDTSEHYDEVLLEITERFVASGSLGKADIGSLLLWKRLQANTRWAKALLNTPDLEVRGATENVFRFANNEALSVPDAARQARSAIGSIPGFKSGDALASSVIVAAAPTRMAIYDRRAHHGLTLLGIELSNKSGRYSRYMDVLQKLIAVAAEHDEKWTARQVDQALFTLGNSR